MYKQTLTYKIGQLDSILYLDKGSNTIFLTGNWVTDNIDELKLDSIIKSFDLNHLASITVNGMPINQLDTNGIFFINRLINYLKQNNLSPCLKLNEFNQKLFNRITSNIDHLKDGILEPTRGDVSRENSLTTIIVKSIVISLTFIGHTCLSILQIIKSPASLGLKEIVRTIKNCGFNGIFVVILLNLLIAATLTYEMAPQFTKYGANLFVVNFLGIAMLKEVSPLLTAIIIAGRTGSSITAEIGTMKINEELDALLTIGISPFQKLVIPKLIGVTVAAPLLTVIADIVGMIGGAIVANHYLSISYQMFTERLQNYVSINNYTAGIIKSVAFGISIALIGCIKGFNVKGDANSIGEETTSSVVSSIIMVVLLDAVFAVIFYNIKM